MSERAARRVGFQTEDWKARPAEDKRDALWQACVATQQSTEQRPQLWLHKLLPEDRARLSDLVRPRFSAGALGFDEHKSELRFDGWDTMPGERLKLLHAHGAVARVDYTPDRAGDGGFDAPFIALLRVSDGRIAIQRAEEGMQAGVALKRLCDGAGSMDLVFGGSLKDPEDVADPAAGLTERLSTTFGAPAPKEGKRAVGQEVKGIFDAALAEIPRFGGRDSLALPPGEPWGLGPTTEVFLQPHDALIAALGTAPDFRDRLLALPAGLQLYTLSTEERPLGTLRLEAPFIVSLFGDEDLWFRHPHPAPL